MSTITSMLTSSQSRSMPVFFVLLLTARGMLCALTWDESLAVHPPRQTAIPDEAWMHQSRTPEAAHAAEAPSAASPQVSEQPEAPIDPREAMQSFARPGSGTRAAAVEAVESLAVQIGSVLRAVMHIKELSAQSSSELARQQRQVQTLHDRMANDTNRQAALVAEYVEDLGRLTASKASAMTKLDLDAAADIQAQIERVWSYVTAAHLHAARSLEDSDSLADVWLSLQKAKAQEQADLAASLQLLAAAAREAGQQLIRQADKLQQDTDVAMAKHHELDVQAGRNGSMMAVRRELSQISHRALQTLKVSENDLAAARARFQQLWRVELVARQQDALGEALAASVADQLEDLRWRRNVALAIDAYPEAHATQAALDKLHGVQAAITHQQQLKGGEAALSPQQRLQQRQEGAPGSQEQPGALGGASEVLGREGGGLLGFQAAGGVAEADRAGGAAAGVRDLTHQEALRRALEDYKTKLAAQRNAAAALSHLELLRQHLVLGEVTPGQALTSLREIEHL